ncbi:hypothetical protein TWF696_007348 [Orbilia brochopaga]|uniref:Uncharacterized protein n=1 Tax=Orbilia brochopaga TaxID=3140254 RepID=A0AAV9URN7_9PEZI
MSLEATVTLILNLVGVVLNAAALWQQIIANYRNYNANHMHNANEDVDIESGDANLADRPQPVDNSAAGMDIPLTPMPPPPKSEP